MTLEGESLARDVRIWILARRRWYDAAGAGDPNALDPRRSLAHYRHTHTRATTNL